MWPLLRVTDPKTPSEELLKWLFKFLAQEMKDKKNLLLSLWLFGQG